MPENKESTLRGMYNWVMNYDKDEAAAKKTKKKKPEDKKYLTQAEQLRRLQD